MMHAPNCPVDPYTLRYPLMASEKLNGWRMLVIGGRLMTKSFKPQPNKRLMGHFAELLELSLKGWVFDCELYAPGFSLEHIQSIAQSTDADPAGLLANVFDMLTAPEFLVSKRTMSYQRRYDRYMNLLASPPANTRAVVNSSIVSADELMDLYQDTIAIGGEGLMVRDPSRSHYAGRCPVRSGIMYKIKPATLRLPEPRAREALPVHCP